MNLEMVKRSVRIRLKHIAIWLPIVVIISILVTFLFQYYALSLEMSIIFTSVVGIGLYTLSEIRFRNKYRKCVCCQIPFRVIDIPKESPTRRELFRMRSYVDSPQNVHRGFICNKCDRILCENCLSQQSDACPKCSSSNHMVAWVEQS